MAYLTISEVYLDLGIFLRLRTPKIKIDCFSFSYID